MHELDVAENKERKERGADENGPRQPSVVLGRRLVLQRESKACVGHILLLRLLLFA